MHALSKNNCLSKNVCIRYIFANWTIQVFWGTSVAFTDKQSKFTDSDTERNNKNEIICIYKKKEIISLLILSQNAQWYLGKVFDHGSCNTSLWNELN